MRFRLLCVDRIRERPVAALVGDFARRLQRYHAIDIVEVDAADGRDPARAMREEGERLLRRLVPGEPLWLLERTGTELSSVELADRLTALERDGVARVTIAVAGAFGAGSDLLQRANFLWSLSRLTLLHEWARALAVEQLYRAAKISRREPYHH